MDILLKNVDFQYANFEGKIAVALSGGIDSMCLLDFLWKFPNRKYELLAINVEHGIRGKSSLDDSAFVEDYCRKQGIKLIKAKVNSLEYAKEQKISVETSARILRYEVFEKVLNCKDADLIALAHHSDDLCETIVMRLFRGTGIDGLTGIKNRDSFIRPFLSISREDVVGYQKRNAIPFVYDESNEDNDYTRNFVRNELLPLVSTKWENYRKSLLRLSRTALELSEFLDKISPKPKIDADTVYLEISDLITSELPLKKQSIRKAVSLLCDGIDFEEINLNDILDLLNLKNGACVHLANGLRAYKEYDRLVFAITKNIAKVEIPFMKGEFEFAGRKWEIVPRTNERLRFDIRKIPETSVIRNRENGDVFKRFGGITTSLGDFYTDRKIPKRLRDEYPIIVVGKNVLVTPFEIADEVRGEGENEYTLKIKEE